MFFFLKTKDLIWDELRVSFNLIALTLTNTSQSVSVI